LESCKLEGCDFVRELDIKCELKTESKTCSKSNCGMLNDSYTIWQDSAKECYPTQETITNAFLSDFKSNFENYLSSYNLTDTETLHSTLKYDFEVKETANGFDIIGNPQNKEIKIFNIDTLQIEQKTLDSKLTIVNDAYNFKYSVEPCFKTSVNYPLYNYDDVVAKVKECISQENCLGLDGTSEYGFSWSVSSSNGDMLFDLKPTSQEKFLVVSGNKIGEFLPTLKFAIQLS
jgi:hypothetical protein